jgi:hypothetical protein
MNGEPPVERWIAEAHRGARETARGAELMPPPGVIDYTEATLPDEPAKK